MNDEMNNENTENTQSNEQDHATETVQETALSICQKERDDLKNRVLHLTADFDNYKRRMNKEKTLWMTTAQASIFGELLSVVDDFDRAFSEYEKIADKDGHKEWIVGFELIYKALQKMLENHRVKAMTDYNEFNPEIHEALMQVETTKVPSGHIVEVLQKGYYFKDEVLRPAKVSVAK
jgi:molecular chaperone GrpE